MSDVASPWLWVGKLAPPEQLLAAVPRLSLLERLQSYRQTAVVLVTTPPGFGKTTLLAQWRAALLAERAAVAWLSLDETDQDLQRCLASLVLALDAAGVDTQGLAVRARAQSLDANPERTEATLLNGLCTLDQPVTLMLDDYHLGASAAVDALMLRLVQRCPKQLRLVLATRTRPQWPVMTLKVRGLVHEMDASDLVLSLHEADQILGGTLARSELAIVHTRTEGWAVAIQLARLWLLRANGSAHGLHAFSGRVAEVASYLAEQVIAQLAPDCRDFLLETSLLECFDAELADVARGRNDSAELLARLAPYEALMLPLDAGRSWFRYHRLLADFLRARLEPRRAQHIHRAAAPWLACQADWQGAVAHALAAHEMPLALQLVQQAGGWELVLRRGIAYAQRLLTLFDDAARCSQPVLLLMQAYLHAKLGEQALALELLHMARACIQAAPTPRGQRDLSVITALVQVYFDQCEEPAQWPTDSPAANACLPDDALGQATLLCAGAVAALAWGRMAQAATAAQAARARMRAVGSPLGENYCLIHWAQALSSQGDLAASRQRITEALALAERNFGVDSSLQHLVGCFQAQHLYWQGQWAAALPCLNAGQDTLAHVDGWLDVFAATAETAWRMALRREGMARALASLDASAQLALQRGLARLSLLVQAWRLDLLCQCGQVAQAQALAAALPPATPSSPGLAWRYLEAASLALARWHMAQGAAPAARTQLLRMQDWMLQHGLQLPAWRLQLMALAAQARSAQPPSAPELARQLAPIWSAGLDGLLLELGPLILPLLLAHSATLPAQAGAVIATLRGWQAHPPRTRGLLSAKETQVLDLLRQGLANKAIARALCVSENTVKFHLKQIFQKLGVDSRAGAIAQGLPEH